MARNPRNQRTAKAPAGRATRQPPPENESRHDKFVRLATRRTRLILRQIQLLGNLASSNYESSSDEIERIHQAIDREMDAAFGRFEKSRRAPVEAFTLTMNGNTRGGGAGGGARGGQKDEEDEEEEKADDDGEEEE